MTASNSFLATASLAGLTLLRDGDRPLIHDASRILGLVRDKAPGVAPLFASPLMARAAPEQPVTSVSWYGVHDLSARLLREAPPALRDQAVEALRRMLRHALTLHDDPQVGPLLPGLLTVPSADSVMVAGQHPVLINWGAGPPDLDPGPEALRAHFDAVFGPLCGVTWPEPASVDSHAGTLAAMPVAGQAPPPGAADPPATGGTPPGTSHAAVAAIGGTGNGGTPPPPDSPPAAASPLQPWYARRGVVIGAAVLLLLLSLWLLWWLLWAPGGLLTRPPEVGALHGPMLESLRRERDRLRDLEGQACSPEAAEVLREGYSRPIAPGGAPPLALDAGPPRPPDASAGRDAAAPPATLPPPADLADLPAAPASRMTALARTLEYSAALVLGEGAEGLAMGTAFFVTPDTLITNRHVVEPLGPDAQVVVTSQALGDQLTARVVARTRSSDIGGPDFAILRLAAPAPSAVPLVVAQSVDKLSRVITAGYPGYIAQSDMDFQALIQGEGVAAPSMIFTSGEVSVVQRQGNGSTMIVHTADMSQGNSGGPLVDLCGRVVGVNTFIGIDGVSGRRGLYSLGGRDLLAFLAANGVTAQQSADACAPEGGAAPRPVTDAPDAGTTARRDGGRD